MKKLFAFLAAMLMMAGMVNALGLPQPFVVHLNANTYSDAIGVEVTITDLTHPYTMVLNTNEYGEAAGDWSAAKVPGYEGDKFTITAGGKTIDAVMTNAGIQDLKGNDIMQVYLTDVANVPACPELTCPEDTTPYDALTCPTKEVIKEVPVTKIETNYQCADGTTQYSPCAPIEPKNYTVEYILALFVALGIIFGGYKGYFQFNVREKYINSRGNTAYRWKTIFSKTSVGIKKPVN